jgi:hypothetical protein
MAYIGKQPVVGNFVKLDAIVTSATTTFNLLNGGVAYFPQSANNCLVSLNGILQAPTDSYTISGSTIIFSNALTISDVIDFIIVLGDVLNIGTPSDGTVSFAKVTSNLITGATAETSIAGGDSVLIYDDSASALRKMTRTNFVSGIGGIFESRLLHVRDEKANGTAGGTFTSGAWQTRTLNTSLTNEISGASLSSNQIILPAGTYFIYASLPAMHVNNHKAKLRNVTDSSDTLIGTNDYAGSTNTGYVNTNSLIKGRFTIASQKTFEIQHYAATTLAGEGFGTGTSFGVTEVYTDVQIWKVA